MTDLAASKLLAHRLDTKSEAAKARVKSRYRSEGRFRLYGLIALAITTTFLVTLIVDIVRKGLPAFFEHTALMNVVLDKSLLDPEGKGTAEALRAGDYAGVANAALAAAIPGIEGRTARKELQKLLSPGAADDIRDAVVANPVLVGSTKKLPMLLSADADLYLKAPATAITQGPATRGIATPSEVSGEVTVLSSSNDFAPFLVQIKSGLHVRAEDLRKEAARLEKLANAAVTEKIADLRKEADALDARHASAGAPEDLDSKMPSQLVAINGGLVKVKTLANEFIKGDVLIPLKRADEARPGTWNVTTYETAEDNRKVSDRTVAFLETLKSEGRIEKGVSWRFFTSGDSRDPELAGIRGAVVGSLLTLIVTMGFCLPIGILAAIYLEEFAPKNRFTDLVEININNLAAVPSIVFGLLGLAMFLNFFGLPRSAPLVGGLVLALLVLPTIIIAGRAALRAVPPSIKEAALGVGASKHQAVFHHVLPLAMPGIMTGTIIGMAHALGETAPLLMIGMIAFIVDVPKSLTEAATVLPVQIYLWSDLPEAGFKAKTAAAIMVLLVVLFLLNGTAIWLRKKFERRW